MVKFPVLVAVRAEPVGLRVAPFILEANGDTVVSDDIVGVVTYGAMIEGIIFRIRRELSSLGFGYLLTNLAEQIDESSGRIMMDRVQALTRI